MSRINAVISKLFARYNAGALSSHEFIKQCNGARYFAPMNGVVVEARVSPRATAAAAAAAADLAEGVAVWRRYGFGPCAFAARRTTIHASRRAARHLDIRRYPTLSGAL